MEPELNDPLRPWEIAVIVACWVWLGINIWLVQ